MRIFFSAGEPSGDMHGSNLIQALRDVDPGIECVGFGGDRMEAAGCQLLFPLCRFAVMGVWHVFRSAAVFLNLLGRADRFFQYQRPDAVVLIDYPGFNWWVARRAHFRGIPVFYFVPPQLWGWAGWRVSKMRRWVDHVLCGLPFEAEWFRARGVNAQHIGHPYFDELAKQKLDRDFVSRHHAGPGKIIGLLPGSRTQELELNLPTLVRAAAIIHAARPDTRFLMACFKPAHARYAEQYLRGRGPVPIEPYVGRTPEILNLATACVAVSGSVGLELLYHGKPSVVIYRIRSYHVPLFRWLKKARFISLVNLLADEELFPEFLTDRLDADLIAGHVLRWLNDAAAYHAVCGRLAELRRRVASPGACAQAARYLLAAVRQEPMRAKRQAAA
jgi:lipid-A-disaccharide synthase